MLMKVTFEFDTENENFNEEELQTHYQAENMAKCIFEIQNKLKSWEKYNNSEIISIEKVYDEIFDIIQANVNMGKMGY